MIFFTPFFFLGAMVIGMFDKKKYKCHSFLKIWVYLILKIAGVKLEVYGKENLDPNEIYVFACNHQSLIDIPVIAMSVPHQLRWLAKKELFSIPFFGWGLKTVAIPVDRDKKNKKINTIKLAENILKTQSSIVIFPEGTRGEKGKLLPFRTGAALIAIKCKKPIVPFAIINSSDIIPKKKLQVNPGTVKVIINTPIPTFSLKEEDKEELTEKVRNIINLSINKYLA